MSGETHRYLGRQYKLKVRGHIAQEVKLCRGLLIVHSRRPDQTETTKVLVENWFHEQALLKFPERLEICRQNFPNRDEFRPTGLIIRNLEQRWGSMTPTGKLVLNKSLIQASVNEIDYVITHELCHIQHSNHGPDFYKLLDRVMPDWKKRKLKLEHQLS